jgi:hypothetical protein
VSRQPAIIFAAALLFAGAGRAQGQGRVERFQDTLVFTAQSLGSCGSFEILADWQLSVGGRDLFDGNGDFVNEIRHEKVVGRDLFYNSGDPDSFVLGGPGEVEQLKIGADGIMSFSGVPFKIVLPGQGSVFLQTGLTIIDLNSGDILFSAGHDDGMTGNIAAVCEALRR